ncbi:hypothetical protein BKN38_00340 [Helicobacter sp. CLO-3]|uniref:hypothetical protein n=1 Tax=unclassified Helicobacter TaxID=2593540 RepID=UPI0008DA8A15|nr:MULTISPECIES: hypothetical protein [unclassified Helicobacter]OHU85884.1 hypothetical protein BKN38_00340 [Helicobacter sp. CLO-3]
MKKLLLWILGILLGLLLLIYILVFSPIGNAIFKPIIQSQIDKYSPLPLKLETFSLGLTSTEIIIKNDPKLIITLKGDYNLFTLFIDLGLNVDANDISLFGDMVGVPLAGAFEVDSSAKGKVFETLEIKAKSDIAESNTTLDITLDNLTPTKIFADIRALQIDEVLAMIGQKPYINGSLDLDADILGKVAKNEQNEDALEFDGKALLKITNGSFSQKLIAQDFDISVPKTDFTTTLDAIFNMDKVTHKFAFNSNIGSITSSGATTIANLATKSTYGINLTDISAFTPIIGMKVRGAFATNGNIIGDMNDLKISGKTNLADSATTYTASLKSFAPEKITFDLQNLKIEELLYMLYQPIYITGRENAKGEIWDLDKGISASVISTLKGTTQNAAIKKEFDLDMPNTPFSYASEANIKRGVGEAKFVFDSGIAQVNLPKIEIDINKIDIKTPYTAKIPNLKKLKFLTGIELAGAFEANGSAHIAESIQADFHTTSLGGSVDALLKGDDFTAQIKELDLVSLLKMAQYPQVFSAKVNGDLAYNIAKESGNLKAKLSSGRFLQNKLTDALKQYAKFDATGLIFNDIALNSDIKGMTLNSSLDMKSGDFAMNGENIKTDLEKSTINAKLKTAIKGDSVDVNINGAINSPKVDIDFSKLVQKKAEQAVQKEIEKQIDKNPEVQKAVGALKGLFK